MRPASGITIRAPSAFGALTMTYSAGRHLLQIPGPSTVPERVMRAIDMPVIDNI